MGWTWDVVIKPAAQAALKLGNAGGRFKEHLGNCGFPSHFPELRSWALEPSNDECVSVGRFLLLLLLFYYDSWSSGVYFCRVLKGGVFKGRGNWGTLRIPREDWGTWEY